MNNLNIIISEDHKIKDFYLQEILNKIKYEENNKIIYDLSVSSLSDILDEASTLSLFSSIKVIIGQNLDTNKIKENDTEYLNKYIKNINKDVYIILITNKLDSRLKISKIIKENFKVYESEISKDLNEYIKSSLKNNGYKMDDNTIEYFINITGNDINNINNELNKLYMYKINDKVILTEDIKKLVIPTEDVIIYEFTNAYLENNYDLCLKYYDELNSNNQMFDYILVSLANTLRQSLIIKMMSYDGYSNIEISKKLGKKEFYVKKMLERLNRYTIKDLQRKIIKLSKIDLNFKSGKSNIDELKLFLLGKED